MTINRLAPAANEPHGGGSPVVRKDNVTTRLLAAGPNERPRRSDQLRQRVPARRGHPVRIALAADGEQSGAARGTNAHALFPGAAKGIAPTIASAR